EFGEGVPFMFPSSPDTGPGLTAAGKRLVHACNRLGILVDCSHLTEAGFWEVASLTLAPLVATHSNAHTLCASSRNLTDAQLDATWRPWARYFAVAGDDARPTLLDALARFDSPGLAVDLGAGTGRDTAALLRRGWHVVAIDREPEAVERLRALDAGSQLETRLARFEEADWPPCELVNASFALPFCAPEAFPAVWERIVTSLRPGGRFSGQPFGE